MERKHQRLGPEKRFSASFCAERLGGGGASSDIKRFVGGGQQDGFKDSKDGNSGILVGGAFHQGNMEL